MRALILPLLIVILLGVAGVVRGERRLRVSYLQMNSARVTPESKRPLLEPLREPVYECPISSMELSKPLEGNADEEGRPVLKCYDVRILFIDSDLKGSCLEDLPEFGGGLGLNLSDRYLYGYSELGKLMRDRMEYLAWRIQQSIACGTWNAENMIEVTPNAKLLVYHQPYVHEEISALIERMRRCIADAAWSREMRQFEGVDLSE